MGYDDDQGPLLARIYFPQTGVFELHDNSYICYQTLNDEVERKPAIYLRAMPLEIPKHINI